MIYVGWYQKRRIFGPVLYFNIKGGKIWIEWNGTEDEIGEILADKGIPKQDIVVGFHDPFMRQYTDYATG